MRFTPTPDLGPARPGANSPADRAGENRSGNTSLFQQAVARLQALGVQKGEPVALWPWINEILALHGLPPVKKRIPFAVAWWLGSQIEAVWRFFRWESDPLITRFMAAQMAKDHYYDISRARRDFGFSPAISKEAGMAALAEEIRLRNTNNSPEPK